MSKNKKRNIKQSANLFGGYTYYENGKKIGESRPNLFGGGYTNYDAKGKKVGSSEPQIFGGGYNHYDTNSNKVGSSEPSLFGGGSTLYDANRQRSGTVEKDFFTLAAESAAASSHSKSASSSSRSGAAASSPYAWRKFADEGDEYGIDPKDYETEEEYQEAVNEVKYEWRDLVDAGDKYGIDPEDYETEDEYFDAVEEARDAWREKHDDTRWNYDSQPDDFDSEEEYLETIQEERSVDKPDDTDELPKKNEPKPSDYPNMRRYNAARILADNESYIFHGHDYVVCAQFIQNYADTVIAANYLAHNAGFLYSQAIKENFNLPVSLPDEDETQELEFTKILCKIAKRDIPLSLEVWSWCLEQFLPYAQYDRYTAPTLTNYVIDDLYGFPDNYRTEIARYMDKKPDFRQKLAEACQNLPDDLGELIAAALRAGLHETADDLFRRGLKKSGDDWKLINHLAENTMLYCQDGIELESIEYFNAHMLPLVKAINIGMVQDEIEGWEQQINEYIHQVEDESERYAYSRKNAWRKTVPDGKPYDLNPLYYDTEQEYLEDLNEAKYGWRKWYKGEDTLGLDVNDFETQQEYRTAYTARLNEARQKQYEQRERDRLQRQQQYEQSRRLDIEKALEDDTVYIYCGVLFPQASRPYHYRTEDETIKIGDKVVVFVRDQETMGEVVSVGHYLRVAAPFPVEKTKFIFAKAEDETE